MVVTPPLTAARLSVTASSGRRVDAHVGVRVHHAGEPEAALRVVHLHRVVHRDRRRDAREASVLDAEVEALDLRPVRSDDTHVADDQIERAVGHLSAVSPRSRRGRHEAASTGGRGPENRDHAAS
jgi:hypothetical protein